jgi:UDP-N-acetyl-D-mannosaminuronate dehydrogenase
MQIVVGVGEVGKAIGSVLNKLGHEVKFFDIGLSRDYEEAQPGEGCYGLHICIPYSDKFIEEVVGYFDRHGPIIVVVHSTVPPDTCNKLQEKINERIELLSVNKCDVVFSPIRGSHRSNRSLDQAIFEMVKYYASANKTGCLQFCDIFQGLTIKQFSDVRSLEFAKIMSTTYFGWVIAFEKRMHMACEEYGFDFEAAYTEWNKTYNAGMPEKFRRPVLEHMEGKIGGHCVIPNLEFLKPFFPVTEMLYEIKGK